ncbi:hypothetical protein N431DRAFT_471432 [Stipitochalara longipes BDJ]|nr:hypothetical protein N431DRAFT_471432 [Stipitochalara longipes BDJ]
MASPSSFDEDTFSSEAAMNTEGHDGKRILDDSIRRVGATIPNTAYKLSELSPGEGENILVHFAVDEQADDVVEEFVPAHDDLESNIEEHAPVQDYLDSDSQLALALFAEEQLSRSAFMESPLGAVDASNPIAQSFLPSENEELDQTPSNEDDSNGFDGYGSPILRAYKFEVLDEPEPLLVEIILDDIIGIFAFTPVADLKLTEAKETTTTLNKRPLDMDIISVSETFTPATQPTTNHIEEATMVPENLGLVDINSDSRNATIMQQTLSKSEHRMNPTRDSEFVVTKPELSIQVIPEATKRTQDAKFIAKKALLGNLTGPAESLSINYDEEMTRVVIPDVAKPVLGQIAETTILPQKNLACVGFSSPQDDSTSTKSDTPSPAINEPTGLAADIERVSLSDSADGPNVAIMCLNSQEASAIRNELIVLVDALVISSVFLFFNVVVFMTLYLWFQQMLEQEAQI